MKLLFYQPFLENLRNQIEKYLLGKWEIEGKLTKNLFALEPNGTLRTATVLDFETSPQIPIRVEVRDEYNASMVKDFVVRCWMIYRIIAKQGGWRFCFLSRAR